MHNDSSSPIHFCDMVLMDMDATAAATAPLQEEPLQKDLDIEMNTDPTHATEGSDGDHSDSDSDADSGADGEAAFGAFKSSANKFLSERGTDVTSIRRSNSFTSFLTRSERHREKPDAEPSPQEVAKRKVQFRDESENQFLSMELNPPMSSSEKKSCHLTDDDNERMKLEVQMTLMRWDNHESGVIEFDDNKHSIRGLLDLVDDHCPERNRDRNMYNHAERVLKEQIRQHNEGTYLDQERVGKIARESALAEVKRAQYIALKDRIEAEEAWKAPGLKKDSFGDKKKDVGKNPKDKKDKKPNKKEDKKKGLGKLAFWK